MIRKTEVVEASGGFPESKGVRYIRHIVSKEELNGHGRLFSHTVLPSGSSIGWHQHVHDTEPYYILKGEGDFYEGDSENGERKKTHVQAGDVCLINVGQWHALENNSGKDIEIIALIYNEPGYLS
ncbi:MAG: cupin domain-containing protein [Synergistaceae bacterium]|nr:cupin domain-containing protein [Synergistaceae bacterium]